MWLKKTCFKCLSKGHVSENYNSDFLFRIEGCSQKHMLLHDESQLQVLPIYVSNGTHSVKVSGRLNSGLRVNFSYQSISRQIKTDRRRFLNFC